MLYVLYALFFIACVVLIGSVLLQPGKTDAGALFTSNVSSAAFGPRGTASVLSKMTIVAASVFMISAFLVSLPAMQGGVSVLQQVSEEAEAPQPGEEAPVVIDSNTNAAPAADSNTGQPAVDTNSVSNSNAPAEPATDPASEDRGEEPPANN